jgi:DNA-binding transcriptional ArsR family regulator
MVHLYASPLDATFAALSDATRRGVLERLGRDAATISDLATAFGMTLTGMKKHVAVLELAGLVVSEKIGRTRTCRLGPHTLADEAAWIARHQALWDARFAALDSVLDDMKRKERPDA